MNSSMHWLGQGKQTRTVSSGQTNQKLEQKSVINPLIALHGFSAASWSESGYSGLARDGYLKNPVVHRCVKMIADTASSLPWILFEGDKEIDKHPALTLLKRPNFRCTGHELLSKIYASLLIAGNAYITRVDIKNTPREIHCLRSDCVTLVLDDHGWPCAYNHSVGSHTVRYTIDESNSQLLHIALYNPLDDFLGVSPLASAHMALDIHNAASNWNKALLDNSARPSGALVYGASDASNLTQEQFERLKIELEDGYSGAGNAGRPMVLEGGLDWKQMGFSPKDMDFMEARNGAARDIALALGVPPMLLGIPGDNTYSNYQEANRAFLRQTILPLVTKVMASFENWLGNQWNPEFRLDIDRDKIEGLAVDRDSLWKRVNEASFLTVNEKRFATGYGEIDRDEII